MLVHNRPFQQILKLAPIGIVRNKEQPVNRKFLLSDYPLALASRVIGIGVEHEGNALSLVGGSAYQILNGVNFKSRVIPPYSQTAWKRGDVRR